MKLSQCRHGVLVVNVKDYMKGRIGMVVGVTQNCTGEAIPLVQWQDNLEPDGTHHSNLEIYEE